MTVERAGKEEGYHDKMAGQVPIILVLITG